MKKIKILYKNLNFQKIYLTKIYKNYAGVAEALGADAGVVLFL